MTPHLSESSRVHQDMRIELWNLFREDVKDVFECTRANMDNYMVVGTLIVASVPWLCKKNLTWRLPLQSDFGRYTYRYIYIYIYIYVYIYIYILYMNFCAYDISILNIRLLNIPYEDVYR